MNARAHTPRATDFLRATAWLFAVRAAGASLTALAPAVLLGSLVARHPDGEALLVRELVPRLAELVQDPRSLSLVVLTPMLMLLAHVLLDPLFERVATALTHGRSVPQAAADSAREIGVQIPFAALSLLVRGATLGLIVGLARGRALAWRELAPVLAAAVPAALLLGLLLVVRDFVVVPVSPRPLSRLYAAVAVLRRFPLRALGYSLGTRLLALAILGATVVPTLRDAPLTGGALGVAYAFVGAGWLTAAALRVLRYVRLEALARRLHHEATAARR